MSDAYPSPLSKLAKMVPVLAFAAALTSSSSQRPGDVRTRFLPSTWFGSGMHAARLESALTRPASVSFVNAPARRSGERYSKQADPEASARGSKLASRRTWPLGTLLRLQHCLDIAADDKLCERRPMGWSRSSWRLSSAVRGVTARRRTQPNIDFAHSWESPKGRPRAWCKTKFAWASVHLRRCCPCDAFGSSTP